MRPSKRLDRLPPYLFARLEQRIAEKKAQGVDVISLGIGDPDTPTPHLVVDSLCDAVSAADRERARLMYLNYPNNPTGAIVPDGLFERAVEFGRQHDVLVVHDASYTETTFDGYVAPSFLETPGAKDVGVEVFSLSKGYNMTGWRTAAIVGNAAAIESYWRLKSNIDSGMFEAVQLATAAALDRSEDTPRETSAVYQRRRDLVCDALREIGVGVTPPKGTIYIWAPVPQGHTSASYCEL